MPDSLNITVRFLDGAFHGRSDGGEPEWPPSPLRLFQALVAAAAAHWNERDHLSHALPALQWLEKQPAPLIISPRGIFGTKYRLYVPDNVSDLVARSWAKGDEATIADYRTEKDVRSTRMQGGDAVHYLWSLSGSDLDFPQMKDILLTATHSITHLGWGTDMVAADAAVISAEEAGKLLGQRWYPFEGDTSTPLRVPRTGTLEDLIRKHASFLNRASADTFRPVPSLSAFALKSYHNGTTPLKIPFAAFSLLKPDASSYHPYDPVRNGKRVAGMLRHLANDGKIAAALGWPQEKINSFMLGHGESEGQPHVPVDGPRLAFLPLPSIEYRGKDRGEMVGSIRRVLVTGLRGCSQKELSQVAQLLTGCSLIDEDTREPVAMLSRLPDSEKMIHQYTKEATTWATVTPVILPGYDDPKKYRRRLFPSAEMESPLGVAEQKQLLTKLELRTELLLRKAIRQAGFSEEMAQNAELDWRGTGFWSGTDLASRYAVPEKLRRFRRLHVRITWRDVQGNPLAVPGPICLGRGRFVGLGLFAPLSAV